MSEQVAVVVLIVRRPVQEILAELRDHRRDRHITVEPR